MKINIIGKPFKLQLYLLIPLLFLLSDYFTYNKLILEKHMMFVMGVFLMKILILAWNIIPPPIYYHSAIVIHSVAMVIVEFIKNDSQLNNTVI